MKTNSFPRVLSGLVILLGLFLLSACQSSPSFTLADAGKTIQLKTGETFTITLEGNPTTGFTWQPQALSGDAIIQAVGEPDFRADRNLAGSGGQITLTFQAVKPGQMELTLIYHRPWEKDVEPIDTYQVTVVVEN